MTPDVFSLFSQAVNKGSVAELIDIRDKYTWKSITIEFIAKRYCNKEKETSLQVAVKNNHYDVVEFLIHQMKFYILLELYPQGKHNKPNRCPFSWEKLDYSQVLPSFVLPAGTFAAISDICKHVPLIKLIEYLIDVVNDEAYWLDFVLNSFMASSLPRHEKIIALELMGAAFIFKQILHTRRKSLCKKAPCHNGPWRGLLCWKQAMALRYSTAGGAEPIPKIPYVFSEIVSSIFEEATEFVTPEELEELEEQSSMHRSIGGWDLLCGPLVVQALLVSKRILSQNKTSQTGPNSFHLENLLHYGIYCKFHQHYICATNICLLILEHSKEFNQNSSPKCVKIFAETFDLMLVCLKRRQPTNGTLKQELSSANLLAIAKFGLEIFANMLPVPPVTLPDRQLFDILEKTYFFISNWLPRLKKDEIRQLTEYLSRYIHFYNQNNGVTSLLHVAIAMVDYHGGLSLYSTSHAVSIIQLLLEAGANPNAVDKNGKTPLHFLAEKYSRDETSESYFIIFQALLDAGGYLDQAAPNGKTVLCILKDQRIRHPTLGYASDPFLDSLIDPQLILPSFHNHTSTSRSI